MEGSSKLSKGNLVSWTMLGVTFFYMLALNILMPLHRDDYEYALVWGTFEKITNMSDVFQSLYFHYFTHGGRMVDFFVLDSFLLWGKEWFNPFNALLFVALIILIYWHSQQKITWQFNPCILGLIIMFCWFGLPDFALVNIWMTGACVYLLTAVLIFAFFLPYHFNFLNKPLFQDSRFAISGMFLGGIIAGWTIENTAATMNLIIFLLLAYNYKKNSLKKWMVAGFIGSVIGFLFLVLAPGNYVRYVDHKTPFFGHILNQLGAGIEISLGLLPAIVFLIIACRIALLAYGKIKQTGRTDSGFHFKVASALRISTIFLMIFSKMNGSFFSFFTSTILYKALSGIFGIGNAHLKEQLFTTLSGLEELLIYLLIVVQLTKYISRKWHLRSRELTPLKTRDFWQHFANIHPAGWHVIALIALAVVNNLVMIASPSFPGRAGFGSAVFFIIGVMTVFIIPKVHEFLLRPQNKRTLLIGVALTVIPMATVVLYQHAVLYTENSQRMVHAEAEINAGMSSVALKPVSLKNEILRHVYFVDLDNHVSKYGFCRYYRIDDVTLIKEPQKSPLDYEKSRDDFKFLAKQLRDFLNFEK